MPLHDHNPTQNLCMHGLDGESHAAGKAAAKAKAAVTAAAKAAAPASAACKPPALEPAVLQSPEISLNPKCAK